MRPRRWVMSGIVSAVISVAVLDAQGVTTAEIRGTVRTTDGRSADAARLRISRADGGVPVLASVTRGRFVALGLPVGGPYRVDVRLLGYEPVTRQGIVLRLGETVELDLQLTPIAGRLDTLQVVASVETTRRRDATVGRTISDSAIRRQPTLNRDLYDFARLVPQLSTRFGLSGAGSSFRYNGYLLDGVSQRQLQGNVGAGAAAKAISLEAVQEYEVILASYDARYGDFTGALVNAVTRRGADEVSGTVFGFVRGDELARQTPFLRNARYEREQYGFSVGGPLVRGRAHFFVAPEFQRLVAPAPGPSIGDGGPTGPLPDTAAVNRFTRALRGYGLDAGSGGRVITSNPNANVFGRVDIDVPEWRSRVAIRENFARSDQTRFSRSAFGTLFPLSSVSSTSTTSSSVTSLEVSTELGSVGTNQLSVGRLSTPISVSSYTRSPVIEVSAGGPGQTLQAGPPTTLQGTSATQRSFELADHVALRLSEAHTFGAGVRLEQFRYNTGALGGRFGRWTFSNLDALEAGTASTFNVLADLGTSRKRLRGAEAAAYVNDRWQATPRLSLSAGLRAELIRFTDRPAYNAAFDSAFGRRTSDFPGRRVEWLPRVGFDWQLGTGATSTLRGGVGLFAVRPPLGWLLPALRFDGMGIRALRCGRGAAPPFTPDPLNPPAACGNGATYGNGDVNLVDPRLRMARSLRSSLGYDRLLPLRVRATVEAIYTRSLTEFVFVNRALAGPRGVDAQGRTLYGPNAAGEARPALIDSSFSAVFELQNVRGGSGTSLSLQLGKTFSSAAQLSVSYTWSRTRDVVSITSSAAVVPGDLWAGSRPAAGDQRLLPLGVSAYDVPHRVVAAGYWRAPWPRWSTDLSFFVIGESGQPYTPVDSSAGGNGDLNLDGSSANDPIYVPRNSADTAEIRFVGGAASVAAQQAAFERFIASQRCLRRQRGRIVERNSCRSPWVTTTAASLRQGIPWLGVHAVTLQVDAFNLLNLVNPSWGRLETPNVNVLRASQSAPNALRPAFTFDPAFAAFSHDNVDSAYQLQLSLRYAF